MLTLPQDCKAVLRLAEDPDLDDDSRVLACGALLHVLSGANAIPGVKGTLAFADDVIVLRLIAGYQKCRYNGLDHGVISVDHTYTLAAGASI